MAPMKARTQWTYDRLNAMFEDQRKNKLSDVDVFKKHGGRGNPGQFSVLKKRYERESAARKDPTDGEMLDFVVHITDVLNRKNKELKELREEIAKLRKPQPNQELIDTLLNDASMRAELLSKLFKNI